MAKPTFSSVDAYPAAQPAAAQELLARVRTAIRKAVPAAVESISYQMPTYKLDGAPLLYFAGWKQHWSLYPATAGVHATFAEELAPYQVEKGTIRFPLAPPVPVELVARIARLRAAELAARAPARRKR